MLNSAGTMEILEIDFNCSDLATIIMAITMARIPVVVQFWNAALKINVGFWPAITASAFATRLLVKITLTTDPAILLPCNPKNHNTLTRTQYSNTAPRVSEAENNGAKIPLIRLPRVYPKAPSP